MSSNAPVTSNNISSLNKVILPMIRRVMPSVIANSIIGVSPMTGPIGQIHTMRYRYGKSIADPIKLNNAVYAKFVRLNNRKKTHTHQSIIDAGYYPCNKYMGWECREWCDNMYGKNGYIEGHDGYIYFENKDDYTFFIMRWIE